jgi:multidrug efflux system outer membrane protein
MKAAVRPSLLTGLLAVLLAGCSLQPALQRPEASVAAAYPSGPAYALSGRPSAHQPLAAETGWRDFLIDPRLQRLVEIALANNRDLRVAVLNVAQVRAQYRIQRAALLPQLDGVAQSSATRTPGSLSPTGLVEFKHAYSVGLSAAWEIDFFGRLDSLRDQALQQYLATAQARKAFEILLVSQVAEQSLATLAFDELLAVTQNTLATAQASYRLTVLRFEAGIGTALAVSQARSVVEQAAASHAAQLRGRAQAENALVLLLGQPLPDDLPAGLSLSDQALLADVPEGLPADLLTRRPDVMQAEAALLAAYANIGAARAAFLPTISLTGGLGAASASLGSLFKGGSQTWSFVPSISVPIFEGGRLQAELDVAKLQKDISIARYERAIQQAFSEVADGLAARGTYSEQVASTERYVAAEQEAFDISERLFRTGVADYLTVLTAQNGLYAAQQSLVSTRLGRLTSLVTLYRALGGGWVGRTGDTPRPADAGGKG